MGSEGLFLSWGDVFFCIIFVPLSVAAFTFTNTPPSQCDDLTITWTGGQVPFRLLIIPPGRPIINQSIPSDAFSDNAGTYTTQLLLPQFQRVLFTMSDASGISSGGITDLLTVNASLSGRKCNLTSSSPDFYFSLDTDLAECKPYPFTLYTNAVQPITIFGFIPEGDSFTLYPPLGDEYDWANNLTAGTSVTFSMMDSLHRDGGTSDIRVVKKALNESLCNSTNTGSTSSAVPSSTSTPASSSKLNIRLVASIAAGGTIAAAIFTCLCLCLCRRRRKRGRVPVTRVGKSNDTVDLLGGHSANMDIDDSAPLTGYVLTPFMSDQPVPAPLSHKEQMLRSMSDNASLSSMPSTPMLSEYGDSMYLPAAGPSRYPPSPNGTITSMHGSSRSHDGLLVPQNATNRSSYAASSQRVIVHTDIAETLNTDEPIELPPLYSEGRPPIPGLLSSNIPTAAPSADTPSRLRPEKSRRP